MCATEPVGRDPIRLRSAFAPYTEATVLGPNLGYFSSHLKSLGKIGFVLPNPAFVLAPHCAGDGALQPFAESET
jgi:hypothetical protein